MKTTFEECVTEVLKHEGGYVNDPDDAGGETNYGVTVAVARENGYTGHMKDMSIHTAKEIYKKRYWDAVKADQLPESVRYIIFDTGINMGVGRAAKLLQKCAGVSEDGAIGPNTLEASKGVDLYHYALERMYFYCQLVRRKQSQAKFIGGWSNRVMDVVKKAKG
jgi:lysozyme family protein